MALQDEVPSHPDALAELGCSRRSLDRSRAIGPRMPAPSADTPPRFVDAVGELGRLASSRGMSRRLTWVFREHVVFVRDHPFIRFPPPTDTFHRAKQRYEQSSRIGPPPVLTILCALFAGRPDERTVCYLARPDPEAEIQYRFPLHPVDGRAVRGRLRWALISGVARLCPPSPLRAQIQSMGALPSGRP